MKVIITYTSPHIPYQTYETVEGNGIIEAFLKLDKEMRETLKRNDHIDRYNIKITGMDFSLDKKKQK